MFSHVTTLLSSQMNIYLINNIILDDQNIILFVNDQLYKKLIEIIGVNSMIIDTDIIIALISHSNLIYTYNEINKQLLDVKAP